jgi:beta-lactamase class A
MGIAALVAAAALAAAPVDAALARAEHAELRGEPQGQYDAARDLEEVVRDRGGVCAGRIRAYARALVAEAEAVDRLKPRLRAQADARARASRQRIGACRALGAKRSPPVAVGLPAAVFAVRGRAPGRVDAVLERRLAAAARPFSGWAGIYVHDLRTGRTAGWGADSAFPAASLVKLGVLAAAVRAYALPQRSPVYYDLRAMTRWSSNLAANRVLALLGQANVEAGLRLLGMTHSTYTGDYRVGTARGGAPPRVSGRVTTARDVGRALYRLHAAAQRGAFGLSPHQARVALELLLGWERAEANAGVLPLPRGTPAAAKNGWLDDAQHTAALVYTPRGPRVVVVLTYRDGLRVSEARALGARVAHAAL